MKKYIVTALLPLIPFVSLAALGPEFEFHQRPHSICALELYASDKYESLEKVCSAVVIGPNLMLTAAQCTAELPEKPHKIICRNDVKTQVDQVAQNDKFQSERLHSDEQMRKNDTALLILTESISTPNMVLAADKSEFEQILQQTEQCGLFGFGGVKQQDREKGHSKSTRLKPEQIKLENDLVKINGFKGRASGLVEPGDSGGSLACQESETQKWVHLAQVSGRTVQGISLLAPVYRFQNQLESFDAFEQPLQGEALEKEWQANDEFLATQHCQKILERSGAPKLETQNHVECLNRQKEYLNEQFFSGREIKVRLKTYALIQLDQQEGMIQLNGDQSTERLIQNKNPFSIVDHDFNQFIVKDIIEDKVVGDLKIFGQSENFGCVENIICEAGEYKNVEVSIDALALPLLK